MNKVIKVYGLVFGFAMLTGSSFAQKQSGVDLSKSIQAGLELYGIHCQSCHMETGEGLEDIYPPLAKSDFLMADKTRSIKIILNGASGPMKVNGKNYEGEMPAYPLTDQEVSDLLNYIRNSFGNKGGVISPSEISQARKP